MTSPFDSISVGWLLTIVGFVLALGASLHALLYKRDYRSTLSWVALIWLAPIIGALLYLLFGINRIERRAYRRVSPVRKQRRAGQVREPDPAFALTDAQRAAEPLRELIEVVDRVVPQPPTVGNALRMFGSGAETFADMLASIRSARRCVGVCKYIFLPDTTGRQFIEALRDAAARGVEVRVAVDYAGSRDYFPSVVSALRDAGVRAEWFLPVYVPFSMAYFNLRNHRKLLTVDGHIGYTGGMNIADHYAEGNAHGHRMIDTHFRLQGPVVRHMQEAFATDWFFVANEVLDESVWFPECRPAGEVVSRGIAHGPDEGFERIRFALLGALTAAEKSIRIATPYFLPDQVLIYALNIAAMRGVRVDILLPERSDVRIADWASRALLWQLLERGVNIWRVPPPFDHSKLMVVDDRWVLLGSSNWDPRSLRLNFEFNVENYHAALGRQVADLFEQKRRTARQVTLEEMDGRSLPLRVRDGLARLFTPYL